MDYTLRKCILDDVNFIFELKRLCLKWYIGIVYGWNDDVQHEKTENELNRNINYMNIVCVNDVAVGVTTFFDEDDCYRVGLTMIHPDYQNKGIGSAVIKDYIRLAEKIIRELL